ncbi:MAG: radical SAM/Cys-rich protein [Verrucomicrobiales bacterium]|jgi:radical SAM/Cys-rich protein
MVSNNTPPIAASAGAGIPFEHRLEQDGLKLARTAPRVLQINVGKLCNLTCIHCHVNAGPARKEIMTRETVDRILSWVRGTRIQVVDLTGGAPEMIPDFRYLVDELAKDGRHIMDRCNLTILLEDGYGDLPEFMRERNVEIVASMPCYQPDNVTAQRGEGVFDSSIEALQLLNATGYGGEGGLPLNLVYNPVGASLPPDEAELEADYKGALMEHFGIQFHRLYAITNMPVSRFSSWLKNNGQLQDYMALLVQNFNPSSIDGLMCRDTISVDWQGYVYDCDFNQQLGMQLKGSESNGLPLWELELEAFRQTPILTGSHCFGCTAGAGSSCGGALL